MPEDGLDQLRAVRRDLSRRRRLSRRARPRLAVGPADPDPPRLPAVRQPAPGAAARRRRLAAARTASRATSTSTSCARTTRANTPRSAAGMFDGTEHEMAMQQAVFTRRGCDRVMRYAFELAHDAQEARHLGHQVERHHPHDAVLGRALRRDRQGVPGRHDRPVPHRHPDARISCAIPDWFDVVVGSNLFGDILSDLGPAVRRLDRHRAVRQHQSRARISLDVRAGARLGARHRRARHRQPDRPDLVGRDDARPFRRDARRRRRSSARSPRCWPKAAPAPPISAAMPAPRISARRSQRRSARATDEQRRN